MTMTEGALRPDALRVHDGRLSVSLHLPWYRSLPLSCLEAVDVAVAGRPAGVRAVALPGFSGPVTAAAESAVWWDLRDPLEVRLDLAARPGDVVPVQVGLAVRIPYIQLAPGVPLVQRVTLQTEGTVR